MTADIEKKLTELGRAIGSDESIVKNVMVRIEIESVQNRSQSIWKRFFWGRPLKIAAVVLAAFGLAIYFTSYERDPGENKPDPEAAASSPGQDQSLLLNGMSLRLSYERGGWEAFDRQCELAMPTSKKSEHVRLDFYVFRNNVSPLTLKGNDYEYFSNTEY